ncbi:GNAT family N-acetyltransferase [Psychromarinibacter sp. C21-152]|uniref:GNAT family N-acetyltransferase n=1 Tax=Psychromarinibacter sediminicola TaxID=3033385 RepID=A0AAE3NNQ2_9RHOB|nr:GNAT family N-acetyltransferase [Psychromarinibacter sediminicola]MDF0599659.1 GNAT family N-acetyltransferase [Psychromarinibacter sediminicola]
MDRPDTRILPFSEVPAAAWDAVAPTAGRCPMVLRDWTLCTAEAAPPGSEVKVVVAGPPSDPEALLPLLVEPGPLRRHRFIGNDDGGVAIPARRPEALAAVAETVAGLRAPLSLGYYPAASPAVDLLRHACRGRAIALARPQDRPTAPYLALDDSWQAPERHLKKKTAQSIRRRERRLRELGALRVDFLEPSEAEVDALILEAADVEARGWKRAAGTALVDDARQLTFLRRYGRRQARAGRLHLTFLSLDDRPLAMSIGEVVDGVYWAHKTGYDAGYGRYGPGILLQYHLIRHLAGRGVTRLEFCGQLDDFKRTWTETGVATVTLRVYPLNLLGVAAMATDAWAEARHRLARRAGRARRRSRPGGRRRQTHSEEPPADEVAEAGLPLG